MHGDVLCDYDRTVHLLLLYMGIPAPGRYILPILIPFMYLVTLGIGKLYRLSDMIRPIIGKIVCLGVMVYVMAAFAYSLFDRFLGYYL